MNLLNRFSYLGVKKNQSPALQRKIKICNRLSVLLFFVAGIYALMSYARGLPVAFIPLAGVFVCVFILTLNAINKHQLARILASVLPTVIAVIYHGGIMQPGEMPVIASYIFSFGFIIIPFILFDLEEPWLLFGSFGFCLLMVLLTRNFNDWIDLPMDNSFARAATYERVVTVVASGILALNLYIMLRANRFARRQNTLLLEQMAENNDQLKNSERALKEYIRQVERNKIEEDRRSWAAQGISEFAELLRQDIPLAKLSDQLTSKLVDYVGACQGALFLLNQENQQKPYLELMSCYAFDKKRMEEKKLAPGQSLVGQAFMEKQSIYLKKVPDNYVRINSGLGDAPPSVLLLTPLKVNDDVVGVVELAAFKPLEPHQIAFVEKIAESIASAMTLLRNNQRTRILLEDMQKLNLEYQSQEEEMRQNLEELHATQEEMRRKEVSYQESIRDLKRQLGTL